MTLLDKGFSCVSGGGGTPPIFLPHYTKFSEKINEKMWRSLFPRTAKRGVLVVKVSEPLLHKFVASHHTTNPLTSSAIVVDRASVFRCHKPVFVKPVLETPELSVSNAYDSIHRLSQLLSLSRDTKDRVPAQADNLLGREKSQPGL